MFMKKEASVYRQRGIKCSCCDLHSMVYGQDELPTVCSACGGSVSVQWDHLVKESIEVSDYQAPVT